jgi:hypothetical protein
METKPDNIPENFSAINMRKVNPPGYDLTPKDIKIYKHL